MTKRQHLLFYLLISTSLCFAAKNVSSKANAIVKQLYKSKILANPKNASPIVARPSELFHVGLDHYELLAEPLLWAYIDHPEELHLTAKTEACLNKTVAEYSEPNGIIDNCTDIMMEGDYSKEYETKRCAMLLVAIAMPCYMSGIVDLPGLFMCPVSAQKFGHRLEVVRFADGRRVSAIQTGCTYPLECSGMTCSAPLPDFEIPHFTYSPPASSFFSSNWRTILSLIGASCAIIAGVIRLWQIEERKRQLREAATSVVVHAMAQQTSTNVPEKPAPPPISMQNLVTLPNAVEDPPSYNTLFPSTKEPVSITDESIKEAVEKGLHNTGIVKKISK